MQNKIVGCSAGSTCNNDVTCEKAYDGITGPYRNSWTAGSGRMLGEWIKFEMDGEYAITKATITQRTCCDKCDLTTHVKISGSTEGSDEIGIFSDANRTITSSTMLGVKGKYISITASGKLVSTSCTFGIDEVVFYGYPIEAPCPSIALVFALDDSDSVIDSTSNGEVQKFVNQTLAHVPADSSVGILEFADNWNALTTGMVSKADAVLELHKYTVGAGTTNIQLALLKGMEWLDDANLMKVLVLLTDGKQNTWWDSGPGITGEAQKTAVDRATDLKNAGITLFAAGWHDADVSELQAIATSPGHSFYASDLPSLAEEISNAFCGQIKA